MGRLAVPSTAETTARQVESRLRELDRKSAGTATNVEALISAGRHHWSGAGLVSAGGLAQLLSPWVEDVNDGIASFDDGELLLNQPGRWSLWFQYTSDATEPGNSGCMLQSNVAPWGPFTRQLRDERLRGSGYDQAGNLTQSVSWSGIVTAEQAAEPILVGAYWRANGTGVNATAEWILTAHYQGTARLPTVA